MEDFFEKMQKKSEKLLNSAVEGNFKELETLMKEQPQIEKLHVADCFQLKTEPDGALSRCPGSFHKKKFLIMKTRCPGSFQKKKFLIMKTRSKK